MILECLPFASQGSLSCLPGNPDETLLKSVALRSYMQNHGTNPYMTICKNLVLPPLCIQSCMNAHNSFTLLKMTRHMSKCKCLLHVGFLSTIYQLLRAEFGTRPKSGLSESTFAIMRMDPNIKLAFAASYSAYCFTLQESKTCLTMVEGSTNSQVHFSTRIGFCGFPEAFCITSLTSRVGLAFWKSCDLGFSESGEVFWSRKAKPEHVALKNHEIYTPRMFVDI